MTPESSISASSTSEAHAGSHTRSLVIITILFFMWGLLTSLNDVLIPHLNYKF